MFVDGFTTLGVDTMKDQSKCDLLVIEWGISNKTRIVNFDIIDIK